MQEGIVLIPVYSENEKVKALLLKGSFGLEKESLRVTEDGFMLCTMIFPCRFYILKNLFYNVYT